MKNRKQDFALGITAIAFLALFVSTFVFLYPVLGGKTHRYVVRFAHDDGLAPLDVGSAVRLSGAIDVGAVNDIRFAGGTVEGSDDAPQVFIDVEIELARTIEVYDDCEITTDQPAVGGSGYVAIVSLGHSGTVVAPGSTIQGKPPQSLAAVIGQIGRRLIGPEGLIDQLDRLIDPEREDSIAAKILLSLDDVNAMSRRIREQLNPEDRRVLLGKLHNMLDQLNATTAAVRSEMELKNRGSAMAKVHTALDLIRDDLSEVRELLQDSRPLVTETLSNVAHATRVMDQEIIAALRREFAEKNPDSVLARLRVSMEGIEGTVQNLERISELGVALVVGNRPTIESGLENIKEASEQLRMGIAELRLNPSVLIWGPKQPSPDKQVIFQAARQFAEAAVRLDDAAARLEAILETTSTGEGSAFSRRDVAEIEAALQSAFERFQQAETLLWEQMK